MAETFGCTSLTGKAAIAPADGIRAARFASGSAGQLSKMTCYIKQAEAGTRQAKCAIYSYDPPNYTVLANGTTEEHSVEQGYEDWMEFEFGTRPSVTAATQYWLALYSEQGVQMWRGTGGFQEYAYTNVAFNGWPSPWSPDSYFDYELAYYATYYEAPPPAAKTLVQATLISIPALIVLPTLGQILKFAGG